MVNDSASANIRPLLPGAILALLAILFGFGLGAVFGAAEDTVKGSLRASADAVFETVYAGDAQKRDAVVGKSWSYTKRAHLHGGAIGAAALGAILLLSMLGRPGRVQKLTAIAFGAGALLYGLFWLMAAFKAPGLGSTHDAKESLTFIAVPGAGLCLLGVLGTLYSTIKATLLKG